MTFARATELRYHFSMTEFRFTSHREIIKLWDALEVRRDSNRTISGYLALARDINRQMPPGSPECSYFKVLRWDERDNIPVQYWEPLCEAAAFRRSKGLTKFGGVTLKVLAAIKTTEYLEKQVSEKIAVA